MTGLRIADDLTLDPDYIGAGAVGILGKRGAGKTFTARVLAEEFWKAGVPFVVIDPMSAWWGLRSDSDGTGPGLPIPIFGGKHGDLPLERTGGAFIADLIIEQRLSVILDLSDLGSHAAERQFMRDFLDRLYRRNDELLHLLIDEADLFAPQRPQPGDQPLLGTMENIVRRGRPHGIGCTLITQRPAVLNKNVLSQVDALIAMRITGINDRKAIEDWTTTHDDMDVATLGLPKLDTGQGWVWIPEQEILKCVQVRALETFDSSATRTRNLDRVKVRIDELDLTAIRERMADTIKRVESDDPVRLRAEIARLRKQLAKQEPQRVEVPVFGEEQRAQLEAALAKFARLRDDLGELFTGTAEMVQRALAEVTLPDLSQIGDQLKQIRPMPEKSLTRAERGQARTLHPEEAHPVLAGTAVNGQWRPSSSQQRILDALAALDTIGVNAPAKNQLALFAEAKPTSGGYRNNLSTLRTAGLIDYPAPSHVALTDAGRELAAPTPDLATTPVLHAYVRRMVGEPRWRILEWLIQAYPKPIEKYELAERIEVQPTSGGYRNNLSMLRTLGLVDYPSPGWVKASAVLMLEAAA